MVGQSLILKLLLKVDGKKDNFNQQLKTTMKNAISKDNLREKGHLFLLGMLMITKQTSGNSY